MGEAAFDDLRDELVSFMRPIAEGDPGREAEVKIERDGVGRLYYAARLSYAPTEEGADRINAGIDIRREYSVERDGEWSLLDSPMEIGRGDLPVTIPIQIGLGGTIVVGRDPGSPAIPDYDPPYPFTGKVGRALVDVSGEHVEDHAARMRAIMARQ